MNKEIHVDILSSMGCNQKEVSRKTERNWVLLHDINQNWSRRYLTHLNVTTVEHPPYLPDLAPANFYLFPHSKSVLKGKRYMDTDDVGKAVKEVSKNGFLGVFPVIEVH